MKIIQTLLVFININQNVNGRAAAAAVVLYLGIPWACHVFAVICSFFLWKA